MKKKKGFGFGIDGNLILPEKIEDDDTSNSDRGYEKDSLYYDVVNRIVDIIKKTFNDELKVEEKGYMATLSTEKRLITNKIRALYWVDFKEREYNNGKYGIRVHIQKIKLYCGQDHDDPKGKLDISVSFKGSGYPCFVISDEDEMDNYFERIIKMTYNRLVKGN
jgi:hypothetical protein|tara:strand:+ start:957 stop:1448 length:492 start_codon:yes stop_codon:yes gene_type:complete